MYGGFDEDWSIPVFRRPSSGTLLRRRTIFVRGGVSPPGSWPAGGHTAVTWPGSVPTKGRSWSRRVWWRCPIITSSLNWKKKIQKIQEKIVKSHGVMTTHQDVFFRRQLQVASSVEFFENFISQKISSNHMVIILFYLLHDSNQDFLDCFRFFDTFFFQMKAADDQIMYT